MVEHGKSLTSPTLVLRTVPASSQRNSSDRTHVGLFPAGYHQSRWISTYFFPRSTCGGLACRSFSPSHSLSLSHPLRPSMCLHRCLRVLHDPLAHLTLNSTDPSLLSSSSTGASSPAGAAPPAQPSPVPPPPSVPTSPTLLRPSPPERQPPSTASLRPVAAAVATAVAFRRMNLDFVSSAVFRVVGVEPAPATAAGAAAPAAAGAAPVAGAADDDADALGGTPLAFCSGEGGRLPPVPVALGSSPSALLSPPSKTTRSKNDRSRPTATLECAPGVGNGEPGLVLSPPAVAGNKEVQVGWT